MIENFKHKGLRQLFEDDNSRGLSAEHVRKLKQILATLRGCDCRPSASISSRAI